MNKENKMTKITIDEFVVFEKESIDKWADEYKEQHKKTPDIFPLEASEAQFSIDYMEATTK